jgi:uncharacterized lipoprotein NlpE involved in copper resistance/heat shock protein HslJ
MKIKAFLLISCTIFFVSCQKQAKRVTTSQETAKKLHDSSSKKVALNLLEGLYKGILPCADCEGIETQICLNENKTYTVKTHYLGKGDKVFEQKGTFTIKGSTIFLHDFENAPNQFLVEKNKLRQLDISGKKITGNLANNYVLTKQKKLIDDVENPNLDKTTVKLNDRMEAKTIVKSVNPAIGKVTLAGTTWKLVQLNGVKCKAKDSKKYFIKLNSKDGRFTTYAGCNTIGGNYVMPSAFAISFSNTMATMMACKNMDIERHFSKMLGDVDSYVLKDTILQLKKGKKEVLATFEPSK